jgi:hypothetical protein
MRRALFLFLSLFLLLSLGLALGGCASAGASTGPPAATHEIAAASAPRSIEPSASSTSSAIPSSSCAVTKPEPPFVPRKPDLATPPAAYRGAWYGSAHLWTMLDRDGEIWRHLPQDAAGLTQKTFWWSANWRPGSEPEPAISVVGLRLDGPGMFEFGPGTNASADFGTAMLVGVVVPTAGCWGVTARYRGASLSIVVSVAAD